MKEKKLTKEGKQSRKVICTPTAPKAIGPYSQGITLKRLAFFSGQIPLVPETGELIEGGIVEQTRQVLKNIDALLTSDGLSAKNVVKTTVYLTNMDNFGELNAEYASYFNFEPPARSCVEVSKLPQGALVEIEVIAFNNKD